MKQNRMKKRYIATVALLGALGAASVMPAPALAGSEREALKRSKTEIATLKQELAEQRALIDKLLSAQASQKAAIEKIETRTAQAPAQTSEQAPAQVAAPTPAQAVNSALPKGLNLYGTMDVNVASTNSGYGRQLTVGSAGMTASSIGIKGQKEVGNGLSVIGEVEMAVDLSTGVAGNGPGGTVGENNTVPSSGGLTGTGNQIFSRQAYAGLASDILGKLTLGRQYSGSYMAVATESNVFGTGFYGNGGLYLASIGGMPTRVNNAIVYRTSPFEGFLKGFSAHATYTAGSENNLENANIVSGTGITDSSGEGYDLALFYRYKGLTTALTGWIVNNASYNAAGGETGLAEHKGLQAIVNYDFGFLKLYGHYATGRYSGGNYENVTKKLSDADGWDFSAKVPFGKHAIMASYARIDDKSRLDQDGSLVGIGYTYKLFDATWLYVNWGKQFNSSNATYSLLNGGDLVGRVVEAGYNPDGVMIGLNTKF